MAKTSQKVRASKVPGRQDTEGTTNWHLPTECGSVIQGVWFSVLSKWRSQTTVVAEKREKYTDKTTSAKCALRKCSRQRTINQDTHGKMKITFYFVLFLIF